MPKAISDKKSQDRLESGSRREKKSSGVRKSVGRSKTRGPAEKFHTGYLSSHFFEGSERAKRELSYTEVEPLVGYLGYNQKEAAVFLEVDPGTISRWKRSKNRIGQLRTKNLLDVDSIIAKGIRIFGSEENFSIWLQTPNYALGDVKPLELLKNPFGVEQVKEAVDALSSGNYL